MLFEFFILGEFVSDNLEGQDTDDGDKNGAAFGVGQYFFEQLSLEGLSETNCGSETGQSVRNLIAHITSNYY